MLQPKKDNYRLSKTDQESLEKEMIIYAEEGASDDDLIDFKNNYVAEKKKVTEKSNGIVPNKKSDSETPIGSSAGKNTNGFPKVDTNSVAPGYGVQPDFNSGQSNKKVDGKTKVFRLPTASDEEEMQRRGIAPPPSEMLKQTANNTNDLYDLDINGNVISEKRNKLFDTLKKQDKTKGFYQQGEEFTSKKKDAENGFSEKTTFELYGSKLIPKTTIKDFKTSEGIDKEIENNDLNLDHPYLYYSTFDKENQPKDTFVESNFGEGKLSELGINTADFDGFLNKKGYKADFLNKEANGLFEGKGTDLTGGYNIQLAKEIQKQRLLDLYMQDINSRDFAKRKLNQEKVNLGKLGADREQLNTQYTLFDSNKVAAFYEKEMPILTQKLKDRDAENLKIYEQHKKGDAGFFYGTKQVLNSGWNGFLDRVNQTSSTMLDKIGLNSNVDELRLLNEERQIQRPNTRDVGYASGKTTTYDGVKYLVTKDGQIIDQDKKIRVTDLFFKPTYDAIVNKSKSGEEDSVFSFQGSAIQAGGVLGDMIVQVALQRGVGIASGATVKAGSLLSKTPISKGIGSAIIAQSALGYSQGLEQTYKAAIDAGIDEKTAKTLAADAAQRMAGLYAITAPLSPQTKAIEGIFGLEGKELIKKAIASYAQTGKKGFIETFKQGGRQFLKKATIFTEEGGKEVFQENIQQYGENYGVNASINRDAGREFLKETISGDEFVNTSILSFASGGLMTVPRMFSSTDKLKTLQQLSKDPIAFEKNLKELVSKGVFANEKADILRKDVKIYSNQSHKIPKNLNRDIAMDVMSDLQDISELELKKKGLDKSFHEEIDAEIELKRENIKSKIKNKNEQNSPTSTAETQPQAKVQEQAEGEKVVESNNSQISNPNDSKESVVENNAISNPSQINEDNGLPTIPDNYNIVDSNESQDVESKIKNKSLFSDGGKFSMLLGGSTENSIPSNVQEINGIEFVQYSNPESGVVDVIMTGTSDTDYVGYYRLYENGKPTNKWSSNLKNQSRNKDNFKTMISGVQSMLPENHQYTEKTSISTDGLRVWEQQLSRGYEIQNDENGNIITNQVAINGDAINNELGIDVNQGTFDNISVSNNKQFESVKKALIPYLKKLGLNEDNVKWENGTVFIDLPVLRKKQPVEEKSTPDTKEPVTEVIPAASVSENKPKETKIIVHATADSKGFALNYNEGVNNEDISQANDPRSHQDRDTQIELNKGNSVIDKQATNKDGDNEISIIAPMTDFSGRSGGSVYDFTIDKNNSSTAKGIKDIIEKNHKFSDKKGNELIKETVGLVKEYISTNEATPTKNPTSDGDVSIGTTNVGKNGVTEQENTPAESVSSSVDVGESKGTPKVKKIKLTDKGQAFNVERKNGKLAVTNTKGEPVSKPTERAVLRKYADNFDFTNGDKAIDRSDFEGNPDAYNGEIAKKSNNPSEIAETIIYAENTDNNGAIKEPTIDHKQAIIAEGIVPITEKGFIDSSDVNDIVPSMKKHYFDDNGRKIDDLAQEMSERAGVEITPKDITDFIKENPKGVKDFYKKGKNKIAESGVLASNEIFDLKAKFEYITGLPATNEFLLKAIEQQNRKNENESVLDNMSDEDFEKAYNDAQQFKKENYGNSEKNTTSESNNESENTPSNERKQRVQGDNTKKPTIKERVAERVKLSDAKIDANSDLIKAKLKAFKDMFPSADINPDDYNTNGFSAEAIVDMVAKAAKSLIEAGITIDEAIKQAIEGYNTHFDDVVDYDAVSEKVKPKKETKNFQSKSGKKSLLNRLVEGGNSKDITEALKELSPNYDVRNQEKSDSEAKSFIDKVGIAEALYAAKNNLIPNADIRMLVYDEALTRLKNEIDNDSEQNPLDREALIQEFKDLSNSFDNEVRNMGQGLSILNYIYNKNQSLKYNLTKVIEDYKRNDPNGEIPAEVKDKFEKLEEKLKDLEEKTKEAEARAKIAEEELAIKNVKEDIDRKKQLANKNKSGLTPAEQNRKKVLKNKFFGRLNDATSLVAMLADPEFREYLGLTFKQAKGDFKNFSNKLINELGKGATKHLDTLFNEAKNTKLKSEQTIIIDEDGNIKIPAKMLRDLVEAGYNDINEISQIIHESILEEYPDVEIRDVRDALTGYGKQINPNKDEITEKINKLKEYGRLLSAYDDVINGEMPKKSGLKRLKPEQKARELRREVNRLAKELNIEPIDLDKQWASALDRIKSSLKNQIEDLDKQIANGEKRKIERTDTPLDSEAIGLKELRDAKKKTLDEMVGKPELTEEQKILRAESFLEKSINKLQEEIDSNNIAFRDKPTKLNSDKLVELRAKKKALLEAKKELRQEAGLIDEQRLKIAKTRVKNQIEDLQTRIDNKDFSKKEVTPVLADNELNSLRAEKEAIYEEFEKQKYLQELQNRSFTKKLTDELLESLGLARAIKASLDLGLIGIQLRGFTYSELFRNPRELGRKLIKTFGAIGSQSKTNKAMSLLIGHPLYPLAKKLDIGITHPDLRNEVREELASGNLLHFIWSLPIIATEKLGGKSITQLKRKSVGDYFIDSVKKQYNKLFKNNKPITESNEKFSIAEQWRNVNAFEAVERGLSTYGNQLRFEEFVRGVERLKIEGKDEINHKDEYEALASYIRTFSGRSKPAGLEMNQKALNVFFFSFKNAVSVFQQLNPYYLFYDLNKTNLKNGKFKPTVAGKMAMATMFKSVASSSATLLFLMAGYNSTKDEEDEEATIELDPRSSDFGKFKMGDFRYDPWGGYVPLITLYARLLTEEVKKSDGTVEKLGESRFGIQSRGDAMSRFLINKESPGFQMFHHYVTSVEKIDEVTGDKSRVNSFGKKLSEDEAFSMYPIFMGSIKDAVKNDFEGVQSFLTAYSILGLGNVQYYETKAGESNEQKFEKSQAKNKLKSLIPEAQKIKEKEVSAVKRMESALNELEMMKIAKQRNIPYYVGNGESIDVSDMDFDSDISEIKKEIESEKKRLKIEDKK